MLINAEDMNELADLLSSYARKTGRTEAMVLVMCQSIITQVAVKNPALADIFTEIVSSAVEAELVRLGRIRQVETDDTVN